MNKEDKAYEYLNKAIQIKPDYADAYALLGAMYINEDRRVDGHKVPVTTEDANHAVAALKKAIEIAETI